MKAEVKRVKHTFPPIYDHTSRILILGTFPSVKSREGDFYYHHPQNRFWKVLAAIYQVDVPATIEQKKEMLLTSHTAIWDVIACCDIIGSSDASIKNVIPADIGRILREAPIECIFANGNKAFELYMKYIYPQTGRKIVKLPSTSPANAAFSFDKLTAIWKQEITPCLTVSRPPMLTLQEVCHELSISVSTGRNWIKSGRLICDAHDGATLLFSTDNVRQLRQSLQTGSNPSLKSRRNKHHISGNAFYASYLPANSPNLSKVRQLLALVEDLSYPADANGIRAILSDCATKLSRHGNFSNEALIKPLQPSSTQLQQLSRQFSEIFDISYTYVPGEDLLGLLYLSLRNMGSRKTNGAYYTPVSTVHKLLDSLPAPLCETTLLDPCCGTGNFLLQLPSPWKPEQMFAYDIDEISIAITRINLSMKFPQTDTKLLNSHIRCQNFLTAPIRDSALLSDSSQEPPRYDYIIGNPPWGFAYSKAEKVALRQCFTSAGKNPESFDLFVEQALHLLHDNGTLAFVLPEAILHVRSHKAVRQLICNSCHIRSLTYLENVFDGVWCPSVILQLVKTNPPLTLKGTEVTTKTAHFTIQQPRPVSASNFHLAITDEEYRLLEKLNSLPLSVTLKENADFAMGIVTGDNKRHLIKVRTDSDSVKTPESEVPNPDITAKDSTDMRLKPILKGANLERYHIMPAQYLIDFQPELYQQCASTDLYFAPEKLLYRFIGKKLIFAYDNQQHLSLNSCNLVIPRIEGLHIKYILTILNSQIAQFFVQKNWNSLKVLRSHLEQIPIPVISQKEQEYFIHMADSLMNASDEKEQLYHQLDRAVADLFGLTEEEYRLIQAI